MVASQVSSALPFWFSPDRKQGDIVVSDGLPDTVFGCVIGRPPSTTYELYALLGVGPYSLAKNII